MTPSPSCSSWWPYLRFLYTVHKMGVWKDRISSPILIYPFEKPYPFIFRFSFSRVEMSVGFLARKSWAWISVFTASVAYSGLTVGVSGVTPTGDFNGEFGLSPVSVDVRSMATDSSCFVELVFNCRSAIGGETEPASSAASCRFAL